MEPIDARAHRRIAWIEAIVLLFNAPFLLFPTTVPAISAIALILLLLGWLLCWRVVGFPLRHTPFNAAFFLLAFMLVVGVLISADPDLTLPKATGMILGLAVWRYIVFHVNFPRAIWYTFLVFTLIGLGMIVLGVFSAAWQFEVGFVAAIFRTLPPQLVNLPGTAEGSVHTNQLAGTLLFFITLPVAFLLDRRAFPRTRSVFLVSLIALVFLGGLLLLSQSRSAWMGAGAGVAVLLVSWLFLTVRPRHKNLVWIVLVVVLLVVVLLIALLWPTLVSALYEEPPSDTPIGTLQTLAFRYEVWRWAVPAINDFAFTGTGLGTFRRVVARLYPIYYASDIAHAHNVFLQTALDVGLPGLIGYLSILFLAGLGTWRVAKRDAQLRPLALGLASGLVAFHVFGFTDTLAFGSKPAIALWMALALLCAAWQTTQRSAS